MKRFICKVFGHKHKTKSNNRIFISSICQRCWNQSDAYLSELNRDKRDDKIYFSNVGES